MESCLFCKIISGEIPSEKVYESDTVLAFLDIKPVNPGHTLVVPKNHYANIYETPDETLGELIAVSKKIAHAIKEGLLADGTNIQINNDPSAGQVIQHTHIHIIPRTESDGLRLWPQHDYPGGEAEVARKKIIAALSKDSR